MIKRICLYGGPGVGKSTLSAEIFSSLKKDNYNAEQIVECIKPLAYSKIPPQSYDQFFNFANQLHNEDKFLRYKNNIIVTDSPVMLAYVYSNYYNLTYCQEILNFCLRYEKDYPSINFFLNRKYNFSSEGRFQNLEESLVIDNQIKELMVNYLNQQFCFYENLKDALDYVNLIKKYLN